MAVSAAVIFDLKTAIGGAVTQQDLESPYPPFGVGSVLGRLLGATLKPHFKIDGVFYFMAGAALLLAVVATVGGWITPPSKQLEKPFEILTPQAGPLAHDPVESSDDPSQPAVPV